MPIINCKETMIPWQQDKEKQECKRMAHGHGAALMTIHIHEYLLKYVPRYIGFREVVCGYVVLVVKLAIFWWASLTQVACIVSIYSGSCPAVEIPTQLVSIYLNTWGPPRG